MTKPKFRRPEPQEQQVLDQLTVWLITPQERARYQALMEEHHYLHHHQLMGEQLCYVAIFGGEWLASDFLISANEFGRIGKMR